MNKSSDERDCLIDTWCGSSFMNKVEHRVGRVESYDLSENANLSFGKESWQGLNSLRPKVLPRPRINLIDFKQTVILSVIYIPLIQFLVKQVAHCTSKD